MCLFIFTIILLLVFFFFFQAEDGIRDHCVTGVQTCALPICIARVLRFEASEPACGSVRQKAPSISPFASGFSHCSFCSVEPYVMSAAQSGELLTLITVDSPPSAAAISSSAST